MGVPYISSIHLNLVFMSPETAVTLPWRNLFTNAEFQQKLCIIAVDEAHCIFEWLGSLSYIFVILQKCLYCSGDLISESVLIKLED